MQNIYGNEKLVLWVAAIVALGGAAAGMTRRRFDEGLLVTPVPVRKAGFDQVNRNLFGRFPPQVGARYAELASQGAEAEIVELLLPYYFADPRTSTQIGLRISLATFQSVSASLGDFDYAAHIPLLAGCDALLTEGDFTTPDLLGDLLGVVSRRFDLAGVGHFPGHENPEAFGGVLDAAFSWLPGSGHSSA